MRTFSNRVLLQCVLFLVCTTVLYELNKSDSEQRMSSCCPFSKMNTCAMLNRSECIKYIECIRGDVQSRVREMLVFMFMFQSSLAMM